MDSRKVVLAIAAVGLAGVGAFLLLRRKGGPSTQFRNIVADYGGTTERIVGEPLSVGISFGYLGEGGEVDVGVGLAPASSVLGTFRPVENWVFTRATLPPSSEWKEARVLVMSKTAGTSGLKNVLKFVQVAGGDRDPKGEGFLLADWDRGALELISRVEASSLEVEYRAA